MTDKLRIIICSDERFSDEKGEKRLQINPADYKRERRIRYRNNRAIGSARNAPQFEKYAEDTLKISTVLDATGVVPGTKESDNVYKLVKEYEDFLYSYNGDIHQPNFIKILWGVLLFTGRLSSMEANYMFFSPQGIPLRAKLDLSFTGYISNEMADRMANRQSPDMSHLVTLREGDSICSVCARIYGDPTLAPQIARANDLGGFRYVEPGTTLLFPHLADNHE